MASGPITSWQIDGEAMETVTDFIWGDCKITADGDCSHEIKRHLVLGRSYDRTRQDIKKQRHYFANKGPFNFMAAVTICGYFGVQKNKVCH